MDNYDFLRKFFERHVKKTEQITGILTRALITDGAHHKQYAIEQTLKILGCDLKNIDYEKGIPS